MSSQVFNLALEATLTMKLEMEGFTIDVFEAITA